MGIKKLLSKYQTHEKDTGSTKTQVILLTSEINNLAKHLKEHRKDFDSRVGLLKMVGKRRKLLNYLQKTEKTVYDNLIKDLSLRK